jgi:stalled ribosome alternative rescue factor ArfA
MKTRKASAVKKALFTPLFAQKIVKAKKGKGAWRRKPKYEKAQSDD